MKKIINIDGRDVVFECNAATPVYFKEQFGRDFFRDLFKMAKATSVQKKGEMNIEAMSYDDIEHLEVAALYDYAWACAKTADASIAPPVQWLTQFGDFSLSTVSEVMELVGTTMSSKKK